MRRIDLNDQRKIDYRPNDHSSKQKIQILVYKGLDLFGRYLFSSTKVTIGRGKDADIILEDPQLSEIQVAVHLQNDNIIISDQSNKLTVYLNGKPVKAAVLELFDLIEIGSYGLKIGLVDVSENGTHPETTLPMHGKENVLENLSPFKKNFSIPETSDNFSNRQKYRKKEEYVIFDSLKPTPKKRPDPTENKIFPVEYFNQKPYDLGEKTLPEFSKKNLEKKSKMKRAEEYPEDFFKLPPYKVPPQKKSSLPTSKRSMKKKELRVPEHEEYTEDFFTLPPYTPHKKKEALFSKSHGESGNIFSGGITNKSRSQKSIASPSAPISRKSRPDSGKNNLITKTSADQLAFPRPSTQRYNLVFSGKLKPGWTILKMKINLNHRFGIEYEKLGNLVLNRPVVLKRNITREKAKKLYHIFDVSGAICSIVPLTEPPEKDPDKSNRGFKKNLSSSDLGKKSKTLSSILGRSARKIIKLRDNSDDEDRRLTTEKDTSSTISLRIKPDSEEKNEVISRRNTEYAHFKSPIQAPPAEWETSESFTDKHDLFPDDLDEDGFHSDTKVISFHPQENTARKELKKPSQPVENREAIPASQMQAEKKHSSSEIEPSKPNNILSISEFWKNDEDDEDSSASFRLKDHLIRATPDGVGGESGKGCIIEILKILNHSVVDVTFLSKGQKYFIYKDTGRKFKLAEHKGGRKCFYYIDKDLQAEVETAGGLLQSVNGPSSAFSSLGKSAHLNRQIITSRNSFRINDGCFEYKLRQISPSLSPRITMAETAKRKPLRHVLSSAVFHVFLLFFMGLIPFNTTSKTPEPESRFVQIDPDLMSALNKPEEKPQKIKLKSRSIEPVKPLTPPPPPKKKPRPKKPPETIANKKSTVKPKQITPSRKIGSKRAIASASRHPNAGGGAGKGNVVNRDIKQVGLLSMLGDSVGIQPQEATAAVTNLDAVASPGAGESNFKVGGIAAKLGTGNISVPSGGYVATKGSAQVLRSTGASGPGRVAALERGNSGEKQVKGMVSAKMTRKVDIQGGMSREVVKRVIDQHLDEISYCYEIALIKNPAIMGRITYEWKIKESGEVGEVNIKSATVNSHEIHACIKNAIKTWKFPQPQGSEVVVSYPFIFDIVGF